jgi:hypothetical protein
MHPAAAAQASEPIIIYRSVNRDGQTFALEPLSMDRLREHFGDAVHVRPRVFIAHETSTHHDQLQGELAGQVIALLTGVSEARLEDIGGVSFRDPATDAELERSLDRPSHTTRPVGELG